MTPDEVLALCKGRKLIIHREQVFFNARDVDTAIAFESKGCRIIPWGTEHQRIQVITVGELLDGKTIDAPVLHQTSRTFKKAPKAEVDVPATEPLFVGEPCLATVVGE